MNKPLARGLLILLILVFLAMDFWAVSAQPVGVDILINEAVNVTPHSAAEIVTVGGSFTTLVLNVSQQNSRWKAYVGNVTGDLVLADNNDLSIYDWDLTIVTGEVFASRSDSVNWSDIACLNNSVLSTEETYLNITTSAVDSINLTFSNSIHKSFWVGSTYISNSSCRSIATYVNATSQTLTENATFQEILLDDSSNLVYATILEQDETGYDENKTFDFQLIIPEDEYAVSPTPYYFYAEIG